MKKKRIPAGIRIVQDQNYYAITILWTAEKCALQQSA